MATGAHGCGLTSAAAAVLLLGAMAAPAAQTCDTSHFPLSSPTQRFADNGDGTVTDKESHLMWMRCAAGQTWVRGTCSGDPALLTWQAALDAARTLNAQGLFFYSDWRVPQLPELAGIAERQCRDPRINLEVFPNTPAAPFWTVTSRPSTTHETLAEAFAFALGFGPDGVHYDAKQEKHDVRFVRTAP